MERQSTGAERKSTGVERKALVVRHADYGACVCMVVCHVPWSDATRSSTIYPSWPATCPWPTAVPLIHGLPHTYIPMRVYCMYVVKQVPGTTHTRFVLIPRCTVKFHYLKRCYRYAPTRPPINLLMPTIRHTDSIHTLMYMVNIRHNIQTNVGIMRHDFLRLTVKLKIPEAMPPGSHSSPSWLPP